MNETKKKFGRFLVAVKNVVILTYFEYADDARVTYTMKAIGNLKKNKTAVSFDNTAIWNKSKRFYLCRDEPLMTINGKQRVLPKAVLVAALADNKWELREALEKLARILRNSRQFVNVYKRTF